MLLARTPDEAHVYVDLHPCDCGEVAFERRSSVGRDGRRSRARVSRQLRALRQGARVVYDKEPGRFRRARLEAVLATYDDLLTKHRG